MADRFQESLRLAYVQQIEQKMSAASATLAQFSQAVAAVNSNWTAYASTSPEAAELQATGLAFAGKCRALVDGQKAALAAALDVIAGGCIDAQGNPLTRQNILDELAAV